jgi:fumarate reductase flavoprotein subunit
MKSLEADLAIIGGGGSGLAAAVRARELGIADVVVVEKTARPGGNAWLAVVMLGLGDRAPSELLAAPESVTAWRDKTFVDMMQFGRWTLDAKLIRAFVDTYPEVVNWLIAKGMRFESGGFDVSGRHFTILGMPERKGHLGISDPARGPGFIGSTATELLLEDCRKLGIHVLTKTRATNIVLDGSGREVRGVVVSGRDDECVINARSVILAAGGFGANETLMRQYFPDQFRQEGPINTLCLGSSTGDGTAMAQEIGLVMGEDMDPGIIGPGHHPWRHSVHEALLRPETLWVNRNGERFINERISVLAGPALARQPGAVMYALLDAGIKEYIKANPSPRQTQMGGLGWLRDLDQDLAAEAGWTRKVVAVADSWEELAEKMGADAGVLRATIDRYNGLCYQGRDADFVKEPQFLLPLRTPPYHAILGVRFCHGTAGGAKVNEGMEVTGPEGLPIAGLYATGDNTSGWVTEWGLPGTTLAFAFTSGYMAAESVARAHVARANHAESD